MRPHVVLICAAIAVVGACRQGDPPAPDAPVATGPRLQQELFDYRLLETTRGVRQWVLRSDRMQKYTGQEDVRLATVHMDFYREGAEFSVLTADSGRVNTLTRKVHTWGAVVVETRDGRRLETQELHYDNETGRITNDVFNRFTRLGDVLTGIGLEATPDLEYIEIKQQVEAAVSDEDTAGGTNP